MEIDRILCTYDEVNRYQQHGYTSKCAFVTDFCTDDSSFVNNIDLYYCQFHESISLMLLYAIPYIFFCFYWLSSTADYYLEPAVAKVAKYLKFSEALAGITLIALANGMPDVIACYVASGQETTEGIELAVGALFGASIFATTIILARVLLNSDYLVLNRNALLRDLGFYLLTNAYLLFIGGMGDLNLYYAVGLYSIYAIFVLFALIEEYRIKSQNAIEPHGDELPRENDFTNAQHQRDMEQQLRPRGNPKSDAPFTGESNHILDNKSCIAYDQQTPNGRQLVFLRVLEAPFNFVRNITIPYMGISKYTKYRLAGYPILTTAFVLWRLELLETIQFNVQWVSIGLCCVGLSVILFRIAEDSRYFNTLNIACVFVGFVISVFWLHIVAELLIDFLNVVKIASGYSLNLIGLTILAWGNSANDFFVDVALAKRGYGIMAVAGIFAGQFFNLNIGFGLLMVRKILSDGFINLNFYGGGKENTVNLVLIICSMCSLAGTLIYAWAKNYFLSQKYAYFLLAFYCVFLILIYVLA